MRMECAPAFNYARDSHETAIITDDSVDAAMQNKVVFSSKDLSLDLRYTVEDLNTLDGINLPSVEIGILDLQQQGHLGLSVYSEFTLTEGQVVTFVLRLPPQAEGNAPGLRGPEKLKKPTAEQSLQSGIPLEGTSNTHAI